MKAVSLLQVIYSFFLGLVVVGLVAIGLTTFYPQPRWPEITWSGQVTPPAEIEAAQQAARAAQEAWPLNASMIPLVVATVILAVSLWRSTQMALISNGLLLGGIFTMIYAVGQSLSGLGGVSRFLVALGALVVTVGVGYLTFVRARPVPGTAPAESGGADGALVQRVAALEGRLEALGRALRD